VKARQRANKRQYGIRPGPPQRYLFSGFLRCGRCGSSFILADARKYACGGFRNGKACSNDLRVSKTLVESKLLASIREDLVRPEVIAEIEKRVTKALAARRKPQPTAKKLKKLQAQVAKPKHAPKPQAAQNAKKDVEIIELRALMKAGTLSEPVAQAAIEKAEEERRALERVEPEREEKQTARIIRMLPRAADVLPECIGKRNLGLRDPRSIVQGRNVLFAAFGGRVPLRPAKTKPGERPYLIARIGLNRGVLLEATASAAGCVKSGSGRICHLFDAHSSCQQGVSPLLRSMRSQG